MAYNKQNFVQEQILNANHLNHMEDGIVDVNINLDTKTTELNSVADMKSYNAKLGEKIRTFGYYSLDDGGGAKYVIVDTGTDDGGSIIELNNGLKAKLIHNGTINARQYGIKLDGVTDDTNRLNLFLKNFGKANLVVDNGTCIISDLVQCEGQWRKDNSTIGWDNKINRLEFINATIKYVGLANKCSVLFYNHYKSVITGLSIARNSNINHIQFVGCWYNKFTNFEVGNIAVNKDITLPANTIKTKSSVDNIFENGFIYDGYIYMDSLDSYINNQNFKSVTMKSYQSDYSIVLKGGHFQKLIFDKCDISYSLISTFNIVDDATTQLSSIILDKCYFDSPIPLFANNNLKSFKLMRTNCIDASSSSNQKTVITTKDYLKNIDLSVKANSQKNLPIYNKNLAINGDLSYHILHPNWLYTTGDIVKTMDTSTTNNKALITFGNAQGVLNFRAVSLPISCNYISYVRLKKVSGSGSLQLALKALFNIYDLAQIADGTEIVMTCREPVYYDAGSTISFYINKNIADQACDLQIEILEIGVLAGELLQLGLPIVKEANMSGLGTTSQRPTNVLNGYEFYDTTLKKKIIYYNSAWYDGMGTVV